MKRKSDKLESFIKGMDKFITTHPQFRKKTNGKSETQIQTEIRPIIIEYLQAYFKNEGFSDYIGKAHKSFYWEGQEGQYGKERRTLFGARNYPDFIITEPYLIAFEYKQSPNGSTVKQGIGQSLMHTLSEDFHYVYFLFHDQSKDKRIEKSSSNSLEKDIIYKMWNEFNIYVRFV